MEIREFKSWAKKHLSSSPSAALDVSVLLEFFLKKDKTWILLHEKDELSAEQFSKLSDAVFARKTGLPVAYITGRKEFYGYDFFVTPDVLIPKPDTEILVESAILKITEKINEEGKNGISSICDICTGSGCVGLSVIKSLSERNEIPSAKLPELTLSDISSAALSIAEKNAKNLLHKELCQKINLVHSDLFSAIPKRFDMILSNPPYVPSKMVDELLKDGRSEPRLALDGDAYEKPSNDGLSLIRRLVPQCMEHLNEGGILIVETGEYNALETKTIFEKSGFSHVKIIKDLEGQERDVYGEKL
ncbi:MAG: peptide chain release factor N(5)-glutamine methyltransferase [Treponema sp.]